MPKEKKNIKVKLNLSIEKNTLNLASDKKGDKGGFPSFDSCINFLLIFLNFSCTPLCSNVFSTKIFI